MHWYKLNDDNTVEKMPIGVFPERDEKSNIGKELVEGQMVSTVFLGLDHSFVPGPPVLFETMIFDGPHDGYMRRYHTYDEAVKGHKEVVDVLSLGLNPNKVLN